MKKGEGGGGCNKIECVLLLPAFLSPHLALADAYPLSNKFLSKVALLHTDGRIDLLCEGWGEAAQERSEVDLRARSSHIFPLYKPETSANARQPPCRK